jgi:hypothetical protein
MRVRRHLDLMRMAAVGHVSGVDQAALAWFLDSDFAKGLRGKSLGGQGGAAFKVAKAEMARYKVSEGDFVKMRTKAIGHSVDTSRLNHDALARFLDCDFAKGLKGKSRAKQSGSDRQVHARTPAWLWGACRDCSRPRLGGPPHLARRMEWTKSVRQSAERQLTSMVPTYPRPLGTRQRDLLAFGQCRKNGTKKKGNMQASRGNPPNPPTSTFSRQHRRQMENEPR